MTDILSQAYFPLLVWTGVGLLTLKWLPDSFPRLLGRGLYWVGVPLQIFTLARQTDLSAAVGTVPLIAVIALLTGLGCAWVTARNVRVLPEVAFPEHPQEAECPQGAELRQLDPTKPTANVDGSINASASLSLVRRGSFIIAAMLGNTGFVGLAIAPTLIPEAYQGWLVLYSVTQNVLGTYGMGVLIASFYGRSSLHHRWWMPLRDMLTVPSLWAFGLGLLSHPVRLPEAAEVGLHASLWFVIPCALVLMGMRLRQLQGWKSFKLAVLPAVIKTLVIPLGVGTLATVWNFPAPGRLAMVLMAGMPSAFAGLILAEEYDLDRELIASSIVVTTGLLFLTIPLWLFVFGYS